MASQLADAECSVNVLRLEAQHVSHAFTFKATGRMLIVLGWRVLTATDAAEKTEDQQGEDNNGSVPSLGIGTQLEPTSTRVLNRQTKPSNGYTQASLIKKLENEGIGRPQKSASTRRKAK